MTTLSVEIDHPRAGARRSVVAAAAENLFPGYFALVMATAAVSIASFLTKSQPVNLLPFN